MSLDASAVEGERARTRAFVAADLPAPVRAAVGAWRDAALRERPGLRAVPEADLHLTLAFLGELDSERLERAGRVVRELPATQVGVRLEPEPLPIPARRPRLVALPACGEALVDLRERLARDLVEAGVQEPSRRPFRPHLTVARRRGRAGSEDRRGRDPCVGLPPLPEEAGRPFGCVRVALYRSELRSQGARYSTLAAIELPPLAADEVI